MTSKGSVLLRLCVKTESAGGRSCQAFDHVAVGELMSELPTLTLL